MAMSTCLTLLAQMSRDECTGRGPSLRAAVIVPTMEVFLMAVVLLMVVVVRDVTRGVEKLITQAFLRPSVIAGKNAIAVNSAPMEGVRTTKKEMDLATATPILVTSARHVRRTALAKLQTRRTA